MVPTKAFTWLISLGLTFASSLTVSFDTAAIGKLPPGWKAMANTGPAPKWEVVKDPTAPSQPYVLAQLSANQETSRFPMAILDRQGFRNGEVSVRFKAVAGREEQSAGVVFRYSDENNYYLVRANALEKNVVAYKVENGHWTSLVLKGRPRQSYGVPHPVQSNTWSILKVAFKGPVFNVYYDHRRIMIAEDGTFHDAGKVGLWTKADSVTYFDDFRVVER